MAFDAVINAYLSTLLGAEYCGLFRRYYPASEFPFFLLRPPPGWPDDPDWLLPARNGVPAALCRLHESLYGKTGVTYDEIFQHLAKTLSNGGLDLQVDGRPGLLGDHEVWDANVGGDDLVLSVLRQMVRKWPNANADGKESRLADAVRRGASWSRGSSRPVPRK